MKDPGRLKEGAHGLERALLDIGASTRGSAKTRKKALAAVGLSTSWWAGLAAGAQNVLAGAKTGLVLSLLGAVAVAVPSFVLLSRHASSARSAAQHELAPPTAPTPEVPSTSPAAPSLEAPELRGPAPAAVAPDTSRLAAELAVVDGARALLARHRPADALKQLNRHRRLYPSAHLAKEAEVLRIEALVQVGRREEAMARGRAFVAANAGSLLASRVTRDLNLAGARSAVSPAPSRDRSGGRDGDARDARAAATRARSRAP